MSPSSPLFWMLAGLVALVALGPLVRFTLAAVLGPAIGRAALAAQPDTITLTSADADRWRDLETIERTARPLEGEGFVAAGDFRVVELQGVHVRLLAHEGRGWYAAIYEHPQAGIWFDLVRFWSDGTSVTWTTSSPTGLEDQPGHPTHRVAGAHPAELFLRACREAASGSPDVEPAMRGAAGRVFCAAYAESMAGRKVRGIAREEILRVA